jgi:hypothetical protein
MGSPSRRFLFVRLGRRGVQKKMGSRLNSELRNSSPAAAGKLSRGRATASGYNKRRRFSRIDQRYALASVSRP